VASVIDILGTAATARPRNGPPKDGTAPAARAGAVRYGHSRERYFTRGRVSNWWNGGGELTVHSSVVAPSPQ